MCSGQQNKQQANLSYKHMNDKIYVEEEKSEDKEWCMDNLIIERHSNDQVHEKHISMGSYYQLSQSI